MRDHQLTMNQLLNIREWQPLQDSLAHFTGLTLVVTDLKGRPMNKASGFLDFCNIARSTEPFATRCRQCTAVSVSESCREGTPLLWRCHCGLLSMTLPYLTDSAKLGAMYVGMVRPLEAETDQLDDVFTPLPVTDYEDFSEELKNAYSAVPCVPIQNLRTTADILFLFCTYTANRASAVHAAYEELHSYYRSILVANHIELPDEEVDRYFTEDESKFFHPDAHHTVSQFNPIYPAITYVTEHVTEQVTSREMAALCKLTPSYFSRLFHEETGENFKTYLLRAKVRSSCTELLANSDSIAEIAAKYGFNDASHYIKVFRSFAGITPAAFRKFRTDETASAGRAL